MILPVVSGGMVAAGLAIFASPIAVAVVIGVTLSKRQR
jgi:anaerobic C4-dicarboxylate transporter